MSRLINKEDATQFLDAARAAWGPDKHAVNHNKEHVWFKKCTGGFTECCEFDNPCDRHAAMNQGRE